jgi:hypothetical protein
MFPDKFDRAWNGRKIVWVKAAISSGEAYYRWGFRDGSKCLVFDQNGMIDKEGNNIKNGQFVLRPVLKKGDSWESFPETQEAYEFKKLLQYSNTKAYEDKYEDDDE